MFGVVLVVLALAAGLAAQPCDLRPSRTWGGFAGSGAVVDGVVVVSEGLNLIVLDPLTLDSLATLEIGVLDSPIERSVVEAVGSHVFAMFGGSLFQVDLSNPAEPVVVSETLISESQALEVVESEGRLWVALEGGGLVSVELATLAVSGVCCQEIEITDLCSRGSQLLGCTSEALVVIDIANLDAPIVVGSLDLDSPRDVMEVEGRIVVAELGSGLALAEVSQVGEITMLSRTPLEHGAGALAAIGSIVVVASTETITTVDLMPLEPLVGEPVSIGAGLAEVLPIGGHVVLIDWIRGVIRVEDILSDPAVVGAQPLVGWIEAISVTEENVLLSTVGGALLIDRAADSRADPVAVYPAPRRSWRGGRSIYRNGIAYLARGEAGLEIVDMLAEPAPAPLWSTESIDATTLVIGGSTMIVHTRFNDIQIYDISNYAAPVLRGSLPAFSFPPPMLLVGDVFVYGFGPEFGGSGGFGLYDVSGPADAIELDRVEFSGSSSKPRDLKFEQGLLFATAGRQGLFVTDISDPTDAQIVGHFSDGIDAGVGLDVRDRVVFVRDRIDRAIHVVDFTDLGAPFRRASVSATRTTDVQIIGDQLYLATPGFAQVLDIIECAACVCDQDRDGEIGIVDLLQYVGRWLDDDPAADLNGDSETSVLDLLLFVDCWLGKPC